MSDKTTAPGHAEITPPQASSPTREALAMFVRNRAAVLGLLLLAFVIGATFAGPCLERVDPFAVVGAPGAAPGDDR
ncbi:MAG: hypothetical protein AB7U66_16745, partial [Hyphomicrobiaceae bacterium]